MKTKLTKLNFFFAVLFFTVLINNFAFAQHPVNQIKMMSYLGGSKYKQVILDAHPSSGWGIGIFTEKKLFGDAYPVLEEVLRKKQVPVVKLNLMWKDNHTFKESDFPAIVNEAKRFIPLINKNPGTKFYLNGAVEHNLNAQQARKLVDLLLAATPAQVQVINNPYNGAILSLSDPRFLNEVHGNKSKVPAGRYAYDYDGQSVVDASLLADRQKYKNAEIFAYWHPAFNLRLASGDKTPRDKRKAAPTKELITAIVAPTEVNDADSSGTSLSKGNLYKNFADRHNTPPESRAYKPVFISPVKTKEVKIGTFVCPYYGPFEKTGHRYYCNRYGHLIGRKKVDVTAAGKKLGTVNPTFRCCDYR